MTDKPMIDKSSEPSSAGASVMHEALTMRQAVEGELAEASATRSAALSEATDILAKARNAAAALQEDVEASAHRTVEQAREQALGIVAQAREEAEHLVAEAHADAVQYEAWARQEAQDEVRRELTGVREGIVERRSELDDGMAALKDALDRALSALDSTSWAAYSAPDLSTLRGAGIAGDVVTPTDDEALLGPRGRARMSLVAAAAETGEADGQLAAGVSAIDSAPDDQILDDRAGNDAVEDAELTVSEGVIVNDGTDSDGADSMDDLAAVASSSGAEFDDGRDAYDDGSRPLGWLFRSAP